MATVNKTNRKAFDALVNRNSGVKQAEFPGTTTVMFCKATGEGGILTAGGDDYYYKSVAAIKRAVRVTMQHADSKPSDCSFWSGNEAELETLAEFAGLSDWIEAMAAKMGIEREN